ncbi:hypothetical protein GMRT_13486 [Giardia muris]|uniref:Uncharacterized protein n=1 Tax=Giardia muris TaxID=5742 RepID=A0A4Z1T6B1_GIAMU|nr:hypothetical protein GMRT_13486 [Giardia muris]|eukprot:TNJ28001.1 hypothetical protein GMRT_13486 [Giardia muris]
MPLLSVPSLIPQTPPLLLINHPSSHPQICARLDSLWGSQQPGLELRAGPFQGVSYETVETIPDYGDSTVLLKAELANYSERSEEAVFNMLSDEALSDLTRFPAAVLYLIEYSVHSPAEVLHQFYSSIVESLGILRQRFSGIGSFPLIVLLVPMGGIVPSHYVQLVEEFITNLIRTAGLQRHQLVHLVNPMQAFPQLLSSLIAVGHEFLTGLARRIEAFPTTFSQCLPRSGERLRSKLLLMGMIRASYFLGVAALLQVPASDLARHAEYALQLHLSSPFLAMLQRGVPGTQHIVDYYQTITLALAQHYEMVGPSTEVILLLASYIRLLGEARLPLKYVGGVLRMLRTPTGVLQASECVESFPSTVEAPDSKTLMSSPILDSDLASASPRQSHSPLPVVYGIFDMNVDRSVSADQFFFSYIKAILALIQLPLRDTFVFSERRKWVSHAHKVMVRLATLALLGELLRIVGLSLGVSASELADIPCPAGQLAEYIKAQNESPLRFVLDFCSRTTDPTVFLVRDGIASMADIQRLIAIIASSVATDFEEPLRKLQHVSLRLRGRLPAGESLDRFMCFLTPDPYLGAISLCCTEILNGLDNIPKDLISTSALANYDKPLYAGSLEACICAASDIAENGLRDFLFARTLDGTGNVITLLRQLAEALHERAVRTLFDYAISASIKASSMTGVLALPSISADARMKLLTLAIYAQLTGRDDIYLECTLDDCLKNSLEETLTNFRQLFSITALVRCLDGWNLSQLSTHLSQRLPIILSAKGIPDRLRAYLLAESFSLLSNVLICARLDSKGVTSFFFGSQLLRPDTAVPSLDDLPVDLLKQLIRSLAEGSGVQTQSVPGYPLRLISLSWDKESYFVSNTAVLSARLSIPSILSTIFKDVGVSLFLRFEGKTPASPIPFVAKYKMAECAEVELEVCRVLITDQIAREVTHLTLNSFQLQFSISKTEPATYAFLAEYSDLVALKEREERFASTRFYSHGEGRLDCLIRHTQRCFSFVGHLRPAISGPVCRVKCGYCLGSPNLYAGLPFVFFLLLYSGQTLDSCQLAVSYQLQPTLAETVTVSGAQYRTTSTASMPLITLAALWGGKEVHVPENQSQLNLALGLNANNTVVIPLIITPTVPCYLQLSFSLGDGQRTILLTPQLVDPSSPTLNDSIPTPTPTPTCCPLFVQAPVTLTVQTHKTSDVGAWHILSLTGLFKEAVTVRNVTLLPQGNSLRLKNSSGVQDILCPPGSLFTVVVEEKPGTSMKDATSEEGVPRGYTIQYIDQPRRPFCILEYSIEQPPLPQLGGETERTLLMQQVFRGLIYAELPVM